MEAKDTVINDEVLDTLPAVDAYPPTYGCLKDHFRAGKKQIAEAQAEITWDKAIREVVGWIAEHFESIYSNDTRHTHISVISNKDWQAKLKEWGINNAHL